MAALLGLERQKQLLGCTSDSSECLAELTNALGADALVSGSIAQLGTRYQLDVRLFSAKTGERLGTARAEAESEDQIPKVISELSDEIAGLASKALGSPRGGKGLPAPPVSSWVSFGLGVASAIAGGAFLYVASSEHALLAADGALTPRLTYGEGQMHASNEGTFQVTGFALLGTAAAAVLVGIVLWVVAR
jgi:hypothetical protein